VSKRQVSLTACVALCLGCQTPDTTRAESRTDVAEPSGPETAVYTPPPEDEPPRIDFEKLDEELAGAPAPAARVLGVLTIASNLVEEGEYDVAIEVLQRCVDVPVEPHLEAACLKMLAAAAVYSAAHYGEALGYTDRWCAVDYADEDPVARVETWQVEAALRFEVGDRTGARRALKRAFRTLEPLAKGSDWTADAMLRLGGIHISLAKLDLTSNANARARRHAQEARRLCATVRDRREAELGPEPYVEETPYGSIVGYEHPELGSARVCLGDAYGVEALIHTRAGRRDKALAVVERCKEALLSNEAWSEDGAWWCAQVDAHWALRGDEPRHARIAAKRYLALLDTYPRHWPTVVYQRARLYADLGAFELRQGAAQDARHYLLRARSLAETAAEAGYEDEPLAKAIGRDLEGLGS